MNLANADRTVPDAPAQPKRRKQVMRYRAWVLVVALLACGAARMVDAQSQSVAQSQFTTACSANQCVVRDLQREAVTGTIVPYGATVQIGPGLYERIGIHRVVKERTPWRPKPTAESVLLGHGDALNFQAAFFMRPDGGTAASAFATYLAAYDVDVWGIDYRWATVPLDVVDHTFMATWNLETDVGDVRIALAVARGVRWLTGSGAGKLDYLGYSRGGQIGYVLQQQETQVPPALRSVKGAVIVDVPLKTDDEALRQTACQIAAQKQAEIAAGIYADRTGQLVRTVGALADTDPNGPSPLPLPFPGLLTNRQVALLFAGQTYFFAPYLSHYHLNAPVLGPLGLAENLVYTDADVVIDVMQHLAPYEANGTMQQGASVVCTDDTPLDDRLGAVTVPLMYIGLQGGFGDYGLYTTTLRSSPDVEVLTISLVSDRQLDFGHDDVF
jgi:hypothetical protein